MLKRKDFFEIVLFNCENQLAYCHSVVCDNCPVTHVECSLILYRTKDEIKHYAITQFNMMSKRTAEHKFDIDSVPCTALRDFNEIDNKKITEIICLLESNKIKEKTVCMRLEIGDLIFIPKSLRLQQELTYKYKPLSPMCEVKNETNL